MLSQVDNEMMTRVGPGTPMGNFLRRFWTPILPVSTLADADGDPAEVRILGEDLVAFRDSAGKLGLIQALCPHRSTPMVYGRNEENGLRCVYHGWKFDVNGICVDMPSEPAYADFSAKVRAVSYPVRELAGIIWAYMGPPAKMPQDLPQIEWTLLPETHRKFVRYEQMCNFVQAIEGDIDSSHIGFLHSGALRGVGISDLVAMDRAPRWVIEPRDYGLMLAAQRTAPEDKSYWRINQWLLPYFTLVASPMDGSYGNGEMYVPIDDTHTQIWALRWSLDGGPLSEELKYTMTKGPSPLVGTLDPATGRLRANLSNHFLQDRDAQRYGGSFTGIYGVREQDTVAVEGMGKIVDRTKEHLGTSDTAIIAMRRILLNGAKALMNGTEPDVVHNADHYRVHAWSKILDQERETFLDNPEVQQLMNSPIQAPAR